MDAAFDEMLDIINGEDNVENEDYNVELQAAMVEMRQLAPPVIPIKVRRELVEVVDFDATNNILDPAVRAQFKAECLFEETDIFTQPVSTTNTMEGYLSNVTFHEQELIQELIPDENIVLFRCNYGKVKLDGYTEPVKQRKTNRGRKKKEKKKKLRKKQGEGMDFNSQVTFVVRSSLTPTPVDELIPYGTKVYKFKIFRTGKLQLPGVHQHLIDDVITCTKKIVQMLNFHLHPAESNPARITNVININPVMKNYKFLIKLLPNYIIDMEALRQILHRERAKQATGGGKEHPPIFMLKYTRQDTKLSIKFSTPILKNPKKKTHINIFMRGKINILGAFHADVTRQICEYLHWIFENNYQVLVVAEGAIKTKIVEPVWIENIEQYSEDESARIIDDFINWIPSLPFLSAEEVDSAIAFIDSTFEYIMKDADDYLREYFAGTEVGDFIDSPRLSYSRTQQ